MNDFNTVNKELTMPTTQTEQTHAAIAIMHGTFLEVQPLTEELNGLQTERDEVLRRTVKEIGVQALGATVAATVREDVEKWAWTIQPVRRSDATLPGNRYNYPGSVKDYAAKGAFRPVKDAEGEIVGVDMSRYSLVLRPNLSKRIMSASLYWVRLIDSNGRPLVDLTTITQ
jgi:hypothetical protein